MSKNVMRKKTKNELKADAIHAFFKDKHLNMHRDNKYGSVEWFTDTYNSRNVDELNRMSRVSSVISEDGLQSLFTMYDIIDNDLANEPTVSHKRGFYHFSRKEPSSMADKSVVLDGIDSERNTEFHSYSLLLHQVS